MRRWVRVIGVVGAATVAGCGAGHHHDATCVPVDRVDLGDSYNGMDVVRMQKCEPPAVPQLSVAPAPASGIYMHLAVYGTCRPPADGGCTPPVQVQVWRSCERNVAMYSRSIKFRRGTIRGVPAAIFGGGQVELYTGDDTVVVFAHTTRRALAAAKALRGTIDGASRGPGEPLPSPVAGAMTGALAC